MKLRYWSVLPGLFVSGTLLAQPGLDADGDGIVTRSEYDAASAERFARLDADGDGALTREELRGGFERGRREFREERAERMAAIDTDGDGAWSLAELQAARPELTQEQFNALDRNGDGLITADERRGRGPMGPGRRPPF